MLTLLVRVEQKEKGMEFQLGVPSKQLETATDVEKAMISALIEVVSKIIREAGQHVQADVRMEDLEPTVVPFKAA